MRCNPAPDGRNPAANDTFQHGLAAGVTAMAFALAIAVAPTSPLAQGLDAEGAIDIIVGSEVTTGEESVSADEERVVAAIEKAGENAAEVRKRVSVDHLEIMFLPDFGDEETAAEIAFEERKTEVAALREAIQGSAVFYHAVDSRSVLLTEIVAIEFDDENNVTIFVAGSESGR